MITFMDYVLREFGTTTDWNFDNSYSSLTATSDALLSFSTPSTLSLNVSSLSTENFATAYTLSTLGQIDGSVSYLYTTVPLGHIPSRSQEIPLKTLIHGYRDIRLPVKLDDEEPGLSMVNGRKPTLLHATLALPPPSTLTALYARRLNALTFLSVSLNSQSVPAPSTSGPPAASVLAHIQRDTGRYSIEALGSTDHALLGARGLWNFGLGPSRSEIEDLESTQSLSSLGGSPDIPIPPSAINSLSSYYARLSSKPSLLSAGAEFYYSPFSHVIGLSTGLRFTTLASHIKPPTAHLLDEAGHSNLFSSKPLAGTSAALSTALLTPSNISHSSFPYTMTLTLTPLTGSLSSTYSVRPSPSLALSSRFDFNVYSWESQYVVGAEIWRGNNHRRRHNNNHANKLTPTSEFSPSNPNQIQTDQHFPHDEDLTNKSWTQRRTETWFTPSERALKESRLDREQENVIKLRMDDGWNIKALWSGRVKALLVTAGVTVGPVAPVTSLLRSRGFGGGVVDEEGRKKRWTGSVGVSIAYST